MFVSLDIRRHKTEGKEKFREEADVRCSRYAPFSPIYTYDTTTIHSSHVHHTFVQFVRLPREIA